MAVDGYISKNLWEASALVYAGFDVTRIEIRSFEDVDFYFEGAPSLDAQGIVDDYQGRKLVLSDAKAYALAFVKLNSLLRDLKKRGEISWQTDSKPDTKDSAYWENARKHIAARQQEREAREERDKRERARKSCR